MTVRQLRLGRWSVREVGVVVVDNSCCPVPHTSSWCLLLYQSTLSYLPSDLSRERARYIFATLRLTLCGCLYRFHFKLAPIITNNDRDLLRDHSAPPPIVEIAFTSSAVWTSLSTPPRAPVANCSPFDLTILACHRPTTISKQTRPKSRRPWTLLRILLLEHLVSR